jgi:hypothetical protein
VIGEPGLAEDPRFKTATARANNEDALDEIITRWTLAMGAPMLNVYCTPLACRRRAYIQSPTFSRIRITRRAICSRAFRTMSWVASPFLTLFRDCRIPRACFGIADVALVRIPGEYSVKSQRYLVKK